MTFSQIEVAVENLCSTVIFDHQSGIEDNSRLRKVMILHLATTLTASQLFKFRSTQMSHRSICERNVNVET